MKDWNTPTNVEIDLMVYSILNVVSYAVYKPITIFRVLYFLKKSSLSIQCVIIMHTWACTNTQSLCKTEFKWLLWHVWIKKTQKHQCNTDRITFFVFALISLFCFVLKDEKNQVLTTYVWYRQVRKIKSVYWCILFAYFICNCGIIHLSHILSIWHGKYVVTQQ